MTKPKEMPAETSEVDDLIFAVTGLRAVEWTPENQKDPKLYQLDQPRVTVTLATTQASTQSAAASKPSAVTVKIGRYDDILRKNVFAMTSESRAIAKVAASVMDSLNKKPIELRDKRAMKIDPETVAAIAIVGDVAATTQPTTKPASHT